MRYLSGTEEKTALEYINRAAHIALHSFCYRARCGSVIVKKNEVIGVGFNGPPLNCDLTRCLKDDLPVDFKSEKACCVHAEQRAIMDALANAPDKILGSRLYFTRVDETGKIERSGKPWCTICSKLSLDAGLAEFVLWHDQGVCVYDTDEYNKLSYEFRR